MFQMSQKLKRGFCFIVVSSVFQFESLKENYAFLDWGKIAPATDNGFGRFFAKI